MLWDDDVEEMRPGGCMYSALFYMEMPVCSFIAADAF